LHLFELVTQILFIQILIKVHKKQYLDRKGRCIFSTNKAKSPKCPTRFFLVTISIDKFSCQTNAVFLFIKVPVECLPLICLNPTFASGQWISWYECHCLMISRRPGCCHHLFDYQFLFCLPIFDAAVVPFNCVAYKKADKEADRDFDLCKFLEE
jgi:hypothetical protein